MIGAIIGDIVGSRFEFNNTNIYNFTLFTPECSFTDDTICTIAIADAIVSGSDYKTKLHEWCRKYPHPMGGYGSSFAQWVRSDDPQPYNSFGNGSAMRVAPVAWAWNSIKEVKEEAAKTAAVTHNHPEGIKGAEAVANAILHLRQTKRLEDLEDVMNLYYPDFRKMDYPRGVFNETCMGTVPLCAKIVLESNSFDDAIRKAVSWGGDSDTIAAIVGSMAEAVFGMREYLWETALDYLPADMLNVIGEFYHELDNR